MSVIELKAGLHQLVDEVQDEQILEAVYTILHRQPREGFDFSARLTPEQKADIQAGLADLEAGWTMTASEVFARYQ